MRICQQCFTEFPSSIIIEGKRRTLSNRRYCLSCSPWGQHNTRKFTKLSPSESKCSRCGHPVGLGRGSKCQSCHVTLWRQRMKLKAIQYKGGRCSVCSFNTYVGALEFHHLDPSKKDFSLSGRTIAWERMKAELDKCILLCSNCHRAVHSGELEVSSEPIF